MKGGSKKKNNKHVACVTHTVKSVCLCVCVREKRMEDATKRTADAQPQARNLCTLEIYDLNAAAHNQKDKLSKEQQQQQ